MIVERFQQRLMQLREERIPLPGSGGTAERHRRLMEVAREDVSLAKMMEAHWDAVAILAEAGREAVPGQLYAVWASEMPGKGLRLETEGNGYRVWGEKRFCSGAGLVDRALMSVGETERRLVEIDLRANAGRLRIDGSGWKTAAFALTSTSTIVFEDAVVEAGGSIGATEWYVERPGFWHGACGPAACWAGGALGLVDWALESRRKDAHTLAHRGALHAAGWEMQVCLEAAGREIDAAPGDAKGAMRRALTVRHVVEQACTDVLRRFARAYGAHPLAMDAEASRRYQEVDLYLRQSHAERDLEALGAMLESA
jgi:hypothetical protein